MRRLHVAIDERFVNSASSAGSFTIKSAARSSIMFETFTLKYKITYGQLHQLLRDHGFKDRLVTLPEPPECHVFWRSDIEWSFHLAVHEPDELALPHDVAHVRRMLDLKCLMETEDFDRWMAESERQLKPSATG